MEDAPGAQVTLLYDEVGGATSSLEFRMSMRLDWADCSWSGILVARNVVVQTGHSMIPESNDRLDY
jgi:hypothetical protein